MRVYASHVAVLSLLLAGCATEHTATGHVVDIHGRPVRGAFVSVGEFPPDWVDPKSGSLPERIVFGPVESDGSFSFYSRRPIRNIVATSGDQKRRGVLSHVTPTNNVVVIQ